MAVVHPMLDLVLAQLLASTGAYAVRVVDGRTGTVVATARGRTDVPGDDPAHHGPDSDDPDADGPDPDDPAAVAHLVRDAVGLDATSDLDDVVVTTRWSVHLLRPSDVPGAFVHLRLGHGSADIPGARRALADPVLHDAVRAALSAQGPTPPRPSPVPRQPQPAPRSGEPAAQRVPRNAPPPGGPNPVATEPGSNTSRPPPGPGVPRPRTAPTTPHPSGPRVPPPREGASGQQPALSELAAVRAAVGEGALAVRALATLTERPIRTDRPTLLKRPVPLPRRTPTVPMPIAAPEPAVAPVLPDVAWSRDVDTMRRLLAGLHRLS